MRVEVLVSTMYQDDHSLLEKMNIQTDTIVINQCNNNEIEEFEYKGHNVKWISICERGVGLSRNTALMRSNADILLFADDDVVYFDDYEKSIIDTFEKYPEASLILFNLQSQNPLRPEYIVSVDHRIRWYNCLKYGAIRIAVRKDAILKANIYYSLLFGGGARHQAGEDNLFILQCLKKGLVGISSSTHIGTVKQEESTWFHGYDEKYYRDRGALFRAMYGKMSYFLLLLFELKNIRHKSKITFFNRMKLEMEGARAFWDI